MAIIRPILAAAVLMVLLAACGSSGGGGGSGPQAPGPAPVPPPDTFDMSFSGIHYHQDYYGNPRYYAVDWSVRNDSTWNPGTVAWSIRRRETGKVLRGTMAVGPNEVVGDGHNVHVEIFEAAAGDTSWIEPGRHTLEVTIDPHNLTRENVANLGNNSHVLIVDVPADPRPAMSNDLRYLGREAHVHEALPGNRFAFHFEAENTGSAPIVGATWRLRSSDVAVPADAFVLPTIPAGGNVEASTSITIATPGTYVVDLILDPEDAIGTDQDADPGNNLRRFTIIVPAPAIPLAAG